MLVNVLVKIAIFFIKYKFPHLFSSFFAPNRQYNRAYVKNYELLDKFCVEQLSCKPAYDITYYFL